MRSHISVLTIAAIFLFFSLTGCASQGDTALVTINTGLRGDGPRLSLLERIMNILSLSDNAIAQAAPSGIDRIELQVRSDASGEVFLTALIPLEDGKVTVEVPAGSDRRFTVSAYFFDPQLAPPDYRRVKGGHDTVNLNPGEEMEITITMLDVPQFLFVSQSGSNSLLVSWTSLTSAEGYYVYRSANPDGPFVRVGTVGDFRTAQFDDLGLQTLDVYYYYRVSLYNSYGEAEPSDIAAGYAASNW